MATPDKNLAYMDIEGRKFSRWKTLSVQRGLEQACSTFGFTASAPRPFDVNPIGVSPGQLAVIGIGTDKLITGFVDVVEGSGSKDNHLFSISGRSKVGDLVDCSVISKPRQFSSYSILNIAQSLADSYDISVSLQAGVEDEIIKYYSVESTASVLEAISRLARLRGLLLFDDPAGGLILGRAGSSKTSDALKVPGNALTMQLTCDASRRYSEYLCKGQSAGDDDNFGTITTEIEGSAFDAGNNRNRTKVIKPETKARKKFCLSRAQWEASTRLGKSTRVTATVRGWRQSTGVLWAPNQNTICTFPDIGLNDAQLLISKVSYSLTEEGQITTLTLLPENAFLAQPITAALLKKIGFTGAKKTGVTLWKT